MGVGLEEFQDGLLWFYMFSPWTAGLTNFWLTMTASALILTTLALVFSRDKQPRIEKPLWQVLYGIGIAIFLWGAFWIGDKASAWLFDFARPEVDSIYSMKTGMPPAVIAALVAGLVWGLLYRLNPKLLPALILSHALWDALVFVWMPI